MNSRGSGPAHPGERALIDRIRSRLPTPPSSLVLGAGDDAAVIAPERGALQVLTTDAIVEGVHFDRRFSSLSDIGHKALAVNVSDIVAMGARPQFALLSLILPDGFTLADLDAVLDGLLEMASTARVAVAGGNISRSPGPLIVDMTVTGSVRPRRILTRSGGRAGDAVYVTGAIGGAAAGLDFLRVRGAERAEGPLADCLRQHRRPEPRLRVGMLLGRNRAASACMDLSDGLADAVRQIAEASGTGATIDASTLPIHPGAAAWFEAQGRDPVLAAVSGGDDYELLFTVPAKSRGRLRTVRSEARGLPVTRIGELTQGADIQLVHGAESLSMPQGFTHFPATNI
ncbi:thiamine-phosphate kinase [soil metagenome]